MEIPEVQAADLHLLERQQASKRLLGAGVVEVTIQEQRRAVLLVLVLLTLQVQRVELLMQQEAQEQLVLLLLNTELLAGVLAQVSVRGMLLILEPIRILLAALHLKEALLLLLAG